MASACVRDLNHLSKLSVLVQINHDIRSADELPCHVKLRDGWPARIHFNPIADALIIQNVDGLVGRVQCIKNAAGSVRKTTRKIELYTSPRGLAC